MQYKHIPLFLMKKVFMFLHIHLNINLELRVQKAGQNSALKCGESIIWEKLIILPTAQ